MSRVRALIAGVFCVLLLACQSAVSSAQTYVYQWAWMGSNVTGTSGVYGTLGEFDSGNTPGAREDAVTWTDQAGRLWLFGGYGVDSKGKDGTLNDLWEFDPARSARGEWAWRGGSKVAGATGAFGTLGHFAAQNFPGSRYSAAAWVGEDGHLWLFGGYFLSSTFTLSGFNDLWEFDPSQGTEGEWAWKGGSKTADTPGIYGVLGQFAAANIPGYRETAQTWTDSSGRLWLFGGYGIDSSGNKGGLNDLWEFDPTMGTYGEWAWKGGSKTWHASSVYGARGQFTSDNVPGARMNTIGWADKDGHFWLFGGELDDSSSTYADFNDLWEYDPSRGANGEWAWTGGSNTGGAPGVYGTLGLFAERNVPGARFGGVSWTDKIGDFWLLGGGKLASPDWWNDSNDLWKFDPSLGVYGEWTWSGGGDLVNKSGTYGIEGEFAVANMPGGRVEAASWTDKDGNFWLFGGDGYDAKSNVGELGDLWEYKELINQKIVLHNVPASAVFSKSPIELTASGGGSGKPVVFSVVSGPAKTGGTHGSVLTLTDAGTVVVAANQAGTSEYAAAPQMTHKIVVKPAGTVASPTIKPGTGTYQSAQTVMIADSTAGAAIYYTTDGSTPSATHGTQYKAAFTVSKSETVKAIGVLAGYTPSKVAAASFTIQ